MSPKATACSAKASSKGGFAFNSITHTRLGRGPLPRADHSPDRRLQAQEQDEAGAAAGAAAAVAPTRRRAVFLGEGNFSFTHSLLHVSDEVLDGYFGGPAVQHGHPEAAAGGHAPLFSASPSTTLELLATSFDGEAEVVEKYPEFGPMRTRMQGFANVTLMHDVNAVLLGELGARLDGEGAEGNGFDFVCWNHPHLGTEDCKLHKVLLHHFLHSARELLRKGGSSAEFRPKVIVPMVEGQGERWEVERVARKLSLRLESCTAFDTSLFPGYECKRNKTGKSFKNGDTKRQWRPGMAGEAPAEAGQERFAASSSDMISFIYRFVESDDGGFRTLADERPAMADTGTASPDNAARNEFVPASRPVARAAVGQATDGRAVKSRGGSFGAPSAAAYECVECGKSFRGAQGLRTHRRQVHELKVYEKIRADEGESLICELCPPELRKVFPNKDALWQHRINKHDAGVDVCVPAHAVEAGARGSKAGAASALVRDKPVWKDDAAERLLGQGVAASAGTPSPDGSSVRVAALQAQGVVKIRESQGCYECPVCQLLIPLDWDMADHLETLKPLVGMQAECPTCAKKFIEHRALKQHYGFCKRRAAA